MFFFFFFWLEKITATTETNILNNQLKRTTTGALWSQHHSGTMTTWEPATSWKACNAPVLCSLFRLGTCPGELHGCVSLSPRHPLSSLFPAGLIICKTQASLQWHFLQLFHHFHGFCSFVLVRLDLGLILCYLIFQDFCLLALHSGKQ